MACTFRKEPFPFWKVRNTLTAFIYFLYIASLFSSISRDRRKASRAPSYFSKTFFPAFFRLIISPPNRFFHVEVCIYCSSWDTKFPCFSECFYMYYESKYGSLFHCLPCCIEKSLPDLRIHGGPAGILFSYLQRSNGKRVAQHHSHLSATDRLLRTYGLLCCSCLCWRQKLWCGI